MITIKLPDGSEKQFEHSVTALEVAQSISSGLARNAIACSVNGEMKDMNAVIDSDASFVLYTFKDEEGKEVYRHSASHILAQAVKRLYPEAKLAIGPAVKNGFYYDIDFGCDITPDDLVKIEQEMSAIVKADFPIVRSVLSRKEAAELFEKKGESYKVEIINDMD